MGPQLANTQNRSSVANSFIVRRCPSRVVEETYTTRTIPRADGTSIPMDVYIPREQGDYLYSLVRDLRPDITLEVGMANGLSSLFIAEALRENGVGRHIAIDPFQHSDWGGAGLALLRKAGLKDLVELIELPSHQALPDLERSGVRPGFVFVDGSHLFDYVMTDFMCTDRVLPVGGLIAFDDSDWPAITCALRYALHNRHYEAAYPEVVIESARYTPTLPARLLRRVAKLSPKLASRLRPDFLTPDYELGIRGRCVVLRKLADDDRDSQSQFHRPF
jgi:predicted O-methyltransferase YrrM